MHSSKLTRALNTFCCLLGLTTGGVALAADYPNRPLRVIVPTSPGGSVDILARLVGQGLAERFSQVVVDNRPGAGGNIGAEIVAKAQPDGYTILVVSSNFAINVSLHGKLPYDPIRDFASISLLGFVPNLLVVHPSLPAKSVKELIALAKTRPGQLNYASSGNGTSPHLTAELFKTMAGINIVHVPYKGASPAFIDLVSGNVQLMFASTVSLLPYVKTGKLRALGVTTLTRVATLPDMPTIAEAGVIGFDVSSWTAVLVPSKTPADIIGKLNAEVKRVLETQGMHQRLSQQGYEIIGSTPKECSEFIQSEIAKWRRVVEWSGMRID